MGTCRVGTLKNLHWAKKGIYYVQKRTAALRTHGQSPRVLATVHISLGLRNYLLL